jgi:hypothetical protein
MLLSQLKQFLQQQLDITDLDGCKVWDVLSTATYYIFDTLGEIKKFSGLSADFIPDNPTVLVCTTDQYSVVTAMLPVSECGLASLLESQLSYVPKYAILEWYFTHQTIGFREVIVCLGNSQEVAPYKNCRVALATLTGGEIPQQIKDTIEADPDQTKVWCFGTIQALDAKLMLAKKLVYGPVTMNKISVISQEHTYAVQ